MANGSFLRFYIEVLVDKRDLKNVVDDLNIISAIDAAWRVNQILRPIASNGVEHLILRTHFDSMAAFDDIIFRRIQPILGLRCTRSHLLSSYLYHESSKPTMRDNTSFIVAEVPATFSGHAVDALRSHDSVEEVAAVFGRVDVIARATTVDARKLGHLQNIVVNLSPKKGKSNYMVCKTALFVK